ncbi:hypothetical protein TUM20985_05020 [Mycobacterium antarcticum]|nr:hypothetical protein TUM20985_05020 [Mycolicibacterium sp. TUM20985]
MAAIAAAGSARSRPRMTKVENAKNTPPTAAFVTAAAVVAIQNGLELMTPVNGQPSRRSIAKRP